MPEGGIMDIIEDDVLPTYVVRYFDREWNPIGPKEVTGQEWNDVSAALRGYMRHQEALACGMPSSYSHLEGVVMLTIEVEHV